MNQIIKDLNWRYAVKKYDSSKKIEEQDLAILKETISLSPSSMGLQAYKVLVIENPEIRAKLQEKSFGQTQITDASHLFVFCGFTEITEDYIKLMVEKTAETRNQALSDLEGFKKFLASKMTMHSDKLEIWTAKQTYIALGHLMQTAAQLRIDSTPMEGFDPHGYDEVLNLSEKGLKANLVCTLGFRAEEDKYQHLQKVRKNHSDLFEII